MPFLRDVETRCCLIGRSKLVGLGHGCSCANSFYRGVHARKNKCYESMISSGYFLYSSFSLIRDVARLGA